MNSQERSVHRRERERESRANVTMEQKEVRLSRRRERERAHCASQTVQEREAHLQWLCLSQQRGFALRLKKRERHVCSKYTSVGSKDWLLRWNRSDIRLQQDRDSHQAIGQQSVHCNPRCWLRHIRCKCAFLSLSPVQFAMHNALSLSLCLLNRTPFDPQSHWHKSPSHVLFYGQILLACHLRSWTWYW